MNQEAQPAKLGFWARQFQPRGGKNQILFDVLFGAVGPILCFAFDPVAFRGGILGKPLLGDYQTFAYLFSGFEILVLILWLSWGARLDFLNNFVGGILVGGAIFCAVLGCLLVPYSLMGLVLVIGVLGFTPFITAFVYFRNGYRAFQSQGGLAADPLQGGSLLLGCLLAFAMPVLLSIGINQFVSNSVEEIIHGDAQQASIAARRVRPLSLLSGAKFDRIVDEYMKDSSDLPRKERLKISYKEATGEDIDPKVAILMD
ncbi:MAG: hypothetical protein JWM21_560 [Acidobacteria bacterium]|nr:hypothetical protein [Acidobacteriota bacterium]